MSEQPQRTDEQIAEEAATKCFNAACDMNAPNFKQIILTAIREARMAERQRTEALRVAVAKVLEGFDNGVFIRNTAGDGQSGWAVKLLPYLQALAVLQDTLKHQPGDSK